MCTLEKRPWVLGGKYVWCHLPQLAPRTHFWPWEVSAPQSLPPKCRSLRKPQGASGNMLPPTRLWKTEVSGVWLLLQRWLLEPSTCHCRASEGDTEDFHQAPQITCLAGNIWEILLCDFSQPVDKGGKCVRKSLESEPYQFKIFFSFNNLFWKLFPIWKLPRS